MDLLLPEELEQILRFLNFVTEDSPGKSLVDIERFLTRDQVLANTGCYRAWLSHKEIIMEGAITRTSVSTGSLLTGPPHLRECSA